MAMEGDEVSNSLDSGVVEIKEPVETLTTPSVPSKVLAKGVCIRCGTEFESNVKKKFCSKLCRLRHHSLKNYRLIKDSADYKAKRKVYEAEWRVKNKAKWNESMRLISKAYRDRKKTEKSLVPVENTNGNM